MDDSKLEARYFNKRRAALITFFKFCRKWSEAKHAVPIFSPKQMADLLAEVWQDLVPYLALSAFGGLRASERRWLASQMGNTLVNLTKGSKTVEFDAAGKPPERSSGNSSIREPESMKYTC